MNTGYTEITVSKSTLLLLVLLISHTFLLAWGAKSHSPTLNEPGHLAAGVSHWQLQRFELYRVNPPLVRMIAAIPVLLTGVETDWSGFHEGLGARPIFEVGKDFITANGERSILLFTYARWACIPFSLTGCIVCFLWGRDLYGPQAGLVSATLWCFSPYILAHGALITTDVPAAALGVTASYMFYLWLKNPCWSRAIFAGAVLGLAELVKMTLVVFYFLWPLLWLLNVIKTRSEPQIFDWKRQGLMLLLCQLISFYILNSGYFFEGSFEKLKHYHFVSKSLAGNDPYQAGNRFAGTLIGRLPVPLPKNYLSGIDIQREDFEKGQTDSYLRGKFQKNGWWYYYLYAFAVKIPLGTLILFFLTLSMSLCGLLPRRFDYAEFVLLAPAILILVLVSSQTGFSKHSRYAIPILPFIFILVGRITLSTKPIVQNISILALIGSIGGSLAVFPHSLSFFNEFAGGPQKGHQHLLGSNLEWGQDILYLKSWMESHPEARPMHVSVDSFYHVGDLGLNCVDLRYLSKSTQKKSGETILKPGWYAIGVNELKRLGIAGDISERSNLSSVEIRLSNALRGKNHSATAGYSIYIFRLTSNDLTEYRAQKDDPFHSH